MQHKEEVIIKYLEGTISNIERRNLERWILRDPKNLSYFKDSVKKFAETSDEITVDAESAFDEFLTRVERKGGKGKRSQNVLRYAAIFVGLMLGSYFVYENVQSFGLEDQTIVQKEHSLNNTEIVITLADGSKQVISSAVDSSVTDAKGNVIANRSLGTLNFSNLNDSQEEELVFNEIYIPNGERLKVVLSDGTEVWLNAGSSLKFPRNFIASTDNRMVYLNGEGFFDVTKNAEKPFIVKTEGIDIKVLGTQFNVSAYNEDEAITTTLVEGAVNMYQSAVPEASLLLRPDDQASYKKDNSSFKKVKVDTDSYTSWIEDRLVLDEMSFEQIITKLERSHNVTIINNVPELNKEVFKGEFKNENIDAILKTISLSKPFSYKINQNVITISR